jgi:MSHA pilin protein MshC
MRGRGFTLIELVVSLMIVGLLAVTAIGRMDFTSAFDRRSAKDKVTAALQFARKAAVAQRRYVCVCVGTRSGAACTAGNRLQLSVDTRAPETSGATFCNGTSEVPLSLPGPDRVCGGATNAVCAPSGIAFGSGGTVIAFDALGRPSGALTLAVSDTSGSVSVVLEAETGYVH